MAASDASNRTTWLKSGAAKKAEHATRGKKELLFEREELSVPDKPYNFPRGSTRLGIVPLRR
ncbi:hypothetical protein COLO4_15473 [Corchorus olitorius]|uniref:Uncharacterized protein n=1 Tax=Corchorus olitorius TaxID=93759 RepID=A0A1R3JMU2_9ROSI|nr:hypothetical protein COLO4_15473 [Corchorus olitorius]